MNTHDTVNNKCSASEKDNRWYHQHFQLARVNLGGVGDNAGAVGATHQYQINEDTAKGDDGGGPDPTEDANKEILKNNDSILTKLLDDSSTSKKTKTSTIISKYYFHDSLLADTDDGSPGGAVKVENAESSGAMDSGVVPDGDRKPAAKAKAKKNETGPRSEGAVSTPKPSKSGSGSTNASSAAERKIDNESTKKRSREELPVHTTPKPRKEVKDESSAGKFSVTRAKSSASKRTPKSEAMASKGNSNAASASRSTTSVSASSRKQKIEKVAIKQSPSARRENGSRRCSPRREGVTNSGGQETSSNSTKSAGKRKRRLDLEGEEGSRTKNQRKQPPAPKAKKAPMIVDLLSESDSDSDD